MAKFGTLAPGAPTLLVAASDAGVLTRRRADYLCDGVADDVQIQAAIDALPANGGRVLLSEGIFSISATILAQLTGSYADPYRPSLVLAGMGKDATRLTSANSVNGHMIQTDTPASELLFSIRDLSLNGNRANQTAGDVLRLRARRNYVENVGVFNGYDGGIYAASGPGGNTVIMVRQCIFNGSNHNIILDGCVDSIIDNAEMGQPVQANIYFNGGGTILVCNSYFWGGQTAGWSCLINVGDVENVMVMNNRFDSNKSHEIALPSGACNWQIIGNEFRGLLAGQEGNYDVINLAGSNTDIIIANNRVINLTGARYSRMVKEGGAGVDYILLLGNNARGGYLNGFHDLTGANNVIASNIS
mgnify:CR=1 FL=1